MTNLAALLAIIIYFIINYVPQVRNLFTVIVLLSVPAKCCAVEMLGIMHSNIKPKKTKMIVFKAMVDSAEET